MSNTLCNEWNLNRNINPITKRKIKPEGAIYKNLLKKCDKNKVKKAEKIEESSKSLSSNFQKDVK